MRTFSENSSREVHNAIFEAEKSLFQKLHRILQPPISEPLLVVLNGFVRTLFKSSDQVEQIRIKAAEAATAFAPLTGMSEQMRELLIKGINSARIQERSVTVQQTLERARRAIPDV